MSQFIWSGIYTLVVFILGIGVGKSNKETVYFDSSDDTVEGWSFKGD